MDWLKVLATMFDTIRPMLPAVLGIFGAVFALIAPLPGRGPRFFQKHDPWRRFKGDARRQVMERAGNQCEGAVFLGWGRCSDPAAEVDHIYPWSRGGPTVPSNGQALCTSHNRRKGAMRPAWWYVISLERRRRSYFSPGAELRVNARVRNTELAAHKTGPALPTENSQRPTR